MSDDPEHPPPPYVGRGGFPDFDWRPRPDPTTLTTEAVDRASSQLTNYFDRALAAQKHLLDAEIRAIERELVVRSKLIEGLHESIRDIPAQIRTEVGAQLLLMVEKQNVITARMDGMKELASALKQAADSGVAAAFAAADKVVQSQYSAFKDTLDKTNDSIVLRISSIENQVDVMREETRISNNERGERITRLETARATNIETRSEGHAALGNVTGIVLAVFGGLSFLLSVAVITLGPHATSPPRTDVTVAPLNPSTVAPQR